MQRPVVNLYWAKGMGVIVPWPSGIELSNQVGGYSCLHPQIEGIYIPLDDDFTSVEDALLEYFTVPTITGFAANTPAIMTWANSD